MKILFFCNLVPDKEGAFEAFAEGLCAELGRCGGSLVLVLAGAPIDVVGAQLSAAGVRWHIVPAWNNAHGAPRPWRVVRKGIGVIRREKPDLIAVHFGDELPTALMSAGLRCVSGADAVWVWHQRQQIRHPRTILTRMFSRIRFLSLVIQHFVVLYEGGRQSLLLRGVSANQVSVISNGVTAPSLKHQAGWLRVALGIPADSVVLTNVSSLILRKRLDLSLRAFAALRKMLAASGGEGGSDAPIPDVHLLLVGKGPQESALNAMVDELEIRPFCHFFGARNDVSDILSDSDILLLTSDAEACPLVVIEAMAAGIPVVSTAAGATPELIVEGETGWVVPPGAEAGLADRLYALVTRPAMKKQAGLNARARWRQRFQLKHMVGAHCRLYEDLVRAKASGQD